MSFIFIGIILLYILEVNSQISTRKFINDTEPYFRFLMEDDYIFLLILKYGNDVNANKYYSARVRDGIVTIILMIFIFLTKLNFLFIVAALLIGFVAFKLPYMQLKTFYKNNLHKINLLLPYYLKSLEILIQHYTVPVALSKSIKTAPEIFKPGLEKLIAKIEAGDSSVDPYMDFAKEYQVRDSMRMMRLLYRLSLGSQENKQEKLMMFARTVSTLQNKSREQKYRDRLESMEKRTMFMLGSTVAGMLGLLMLTMMMMMNL